MEESECTWGWAAGHDNRNEGVEKECELTTGKYRWRSTVGDGQDEYIYATFHQETVLVDCPCGQSWLQRTRLCENQKQSFHLDATEQKYTNIERNHHIVSTTVLWKATTYDDDNVTS